jgi:hypothetical protein
MKQTDTLIEEIPTLPDQFRKKNVMVVQRQDAVSSTENYEQLSAATKRSILKETTIESTGHVWLKRSNSS